MTDPRNLREWLRHGSAQQGELCLFLAASCLGNGYRLSLSKGDKDG